MAEGIYYNQEVTADMLNGIAADLGHTSFNGFGIEKFGADELNGITKDLVSAGVLTSGNRCKVVKDSSGNIIVQTGIIVFNNGAKMEITSPVTVDADNGTVIYAMNNTTQGTCTIEVASSYPTEGDFITLCTINNDGALTDDRVISKAKVKIPTQNVYNKYFSKVSSSSGYKLLTTIDNAVWNLYSYFVITTDSEASRFFECSKISFPFEFVIPELGTYATSVRLLQTDGGISVYCLPRQNRSIDITLL